MGLKFSRRNLLGAGSLAALGALAGTVPVNAKKSHKKRTKDQAPGYYRLKLNDLTITVVSDGSFQQPVSAFGPNVPEAQVKAFLKSNLASLESYRAHANACIIDTGKKRILVDVGCGGAFKKSQGRLASNIKAAGYTEKEIDIVVLSHLHPDTCWGLVHGKATKLTFPNAIYYVNSQEWDYWIDQGSDKSIPDLDRAQIQKTIQVLSAIASKTNRIKAGDEIVPGIQSIDTKGHTPGHISLQIVSKDQAMIISGDVLYHPYVSFEHPEWHMAMDKDAKKAVEARKMILEKAVKEKSLILGFHLPFPGIGRVASHNKTYRWFPEIWKWEV